MAKFIKSFFNTTERRKHSRYEENEEDKSNPLPLGRKLSISRSGRMKQTNKKRHSLTLDVYNQDGQLMAEKPKSTEVQTTQRPSTTENNNRTEKRLSLNVEHEIDTAFEIIHKTVITNDL